MVRVNLLIRAVHAAHTASGRVRVLDDDHTADGIMVDQPAGRSSSQSDLAGDRQHGLLSSSRGLGVVDGSLPARVTFSLTNFQDVESEAIKDNAASLSKNLPTLMRLPGMSANTFNANCLSVS